MITKCKNRREREKKELCPEWRPIRERAEEILKPIRGQDKELGPIRGMQLLTDAPSDGATGPGYRFFDKERNQGQEIQVKK